MRFAAMHRHVLDECAQRVEAASNANDALLAPLCIPAGGRRMS